MHTHRGVPWHRVCDSFDRLRVSLYRSSFPQLQSLIPWNIKAGHHSQVDSPTSASSPELAKTSTSDVQMLCHNQRLVNTNIPIDVNTLHCCGQVQFMIVKVFEIGENSWFCFPQCFHLCGQNSGQCHRQTWLYQNIHSKGSMFSFLRLENSGSNSGRWQPSPQGAKLIQFAICAVTTSLWTTDTFHTDTSRLTSFVLLVSVILIVFSNPNSATIQQRKVEQGHNFSPCLDRGVQCMPQFLVCKTKIYQKFNNNHSDSPLTTVPQSLLLEGEAVSLLFGEGSVEQSRTTKQIQMYWSAKSSSPPNVLPIVTGLTQTATAGEIGVDYEYWNINCTMVRTWHYIAYSC